MNIKTYEVRYKNNLEGVNILITKTSDDTSLKKDRAIFNSKLWINDNTILKNHTDNQELKVNNFICDDKIIEIFGNVL